MSISTHHEGRPAALFLHQGAELYGSDFIFFLVVRAMARYVRALVVLDDEGPLADKFRSLGIEVIVKPLGVLRRKHMNPGGLVYLARTQLSAIRWLTQLIRSENVALVYSNTIGVLPGAMAARRSGVPHVNHVHEIIVQPRWLGRFLSWFSLRFSDLVVCVSTPVKEHLHALVPRSRTDVQVIHNGIDGTSFRQPGLGDPIRKEFGIPADMFVLAMVGRIHFWKGQDFLIRAAAQFKARGGPDFRVLVVGDVYPGYEQLKADLQQQVQDAGLTEEVIFCGFRQDIPAFLQAADVVVLPSTLPDPLPTVVLEAMATGRPVVATAHGGSLEMVEHGTTGYHVSPKDPAEMANRLLALARSPERVAEMGEAGRARFEQLFEIARFEADICAVLCERLGLALPDAAPVAEDSLTSTLHA